MKRILMILTVALVLVAMVVATSAPAFAAKSKCFHTGGGPPHGCDPGSNAFFNTR